MIGYDLRYLPLAIGDFTDFMQVGLLYGDPDIAFFYDPKNPTGGEPRLSHINIRNFHSVIEDYKCLADKVIPNTNYDWPTPDLRGKYLFYEIYNNIFVDGVKPLRFKSAEWAESFMKEHSVRYCVQLRKSKNVHSSNRDTDYGVWLEFFRRSKEKFLLLGETDATCRLENTIIAKDFKTSIEQDLALAAAADVFMGTPSGMAGAVLFNDKPYKIFRPNLNPARCQVYTVYRGIGRWAWAKDNQDYLVGPETVERIEREFAKCVR